MIMINVLTLTVASFLAGYGVASNKLPFNLKLETWMMMIFWAGVGTNLGFIVLYILRHS